MENAGLLEKKYFKHGGRQIATLKYILILNSDLKYMKTVNTTTWQRDIVNTVS